MLIAQNKQRLQELVGLIEKINESDYLTSDNTLSGSTIGQHIRHIIEFYQCLAFERSNNALSYDNRKRDHRIETDKIFAQLKVTEVIEWLSAADLSEEIVFQANYTNDMSDPVSMKSSVGRELAYALDHMIHHLAILKISLLDRGYKLNENLGVAPSTVRHRKEQCVQ